tara:strand:+ start:33704 stop:37111 length:3408 start_codon:yes stop_codon:yes gene_type:complete
MLDSEIRQLLFEDDPKQVAAKNGYAVVVGTRGLDSRKGYRIECEVVIPNNEFDSIKETLIEAGVISSSSSVQYDTFEGLMYGEKIEDEEGNITCKPGIFPNAEEGGEDTGRELRDQLRLNSLVSTASGVGIYDDITKQEFEILGNEWRKSGYSSEAGFWPPHKGKVWQRHGPNSDEIDECPWCLARHKKIGGTGDPNSPGGFAAKKTVRSRVNSGEIGWVCGDPVRPPFIDRPVGKSAKRNRMSFGRQGQGAEGTPEWLQYQYNEVVYIVLNQYKADIAEAVIERLGLDDTPNTALGGYSIKELILGPKSAESVYDNLTFKIPRNAYTKVFTGAPPHRQHRDLELPGKVNFGKFYVYYVEAVLNMDTAMDYIPGEFDERGDKIGLEKPVKFGKDDQEKHPWSSEDKPLFPPASAIFKQVTNVVSQAVRGGLLDKDPSETGLTYKSSAGHIYSVIKIPTGIKGLNFLIDPFMPTKQSEVDRRPGYHGDKELPVGMIGKHLHGLHKSEVYGHLGQMGKILYDDLDFYFKDKFDLTLAPWDPVKPYPIDHDGNIYFIPDDDLLLVNIAGYDEITSAGYDKYEKLMYRIPGKVIATPKPGQPGTYKIMVNAGSCPKCLANHKSASEDLELLKDKKGTRQYKFKLAELKEIALLHSKRHEEEFHSNNVMGLESATPMDDEFIAHIKKNSKLSQDLNTYQIFSQAWIALNIQRIVDRGDLVAHPFEEGKVISPGELLQALSIKLKGQEIKKNISKSGAKLGHDLMLLSPDIAIMGQEYPSLDGDLSKLKKAGTVKEPVKVKVLSGEKSSEDNLVQYFDMSLDDARYMIKTYPGLFRVLNDKLEPERSSDQYNEDDEVIVKIFSDINDDKSHLDRDGYEIIMSTKRAKEIINSGRGYIVRQVGGNIDAIQEVKKDLLTYFRNYDLALLGDIDIEDGKADIGDLSWKDKVAIPINNASVVLSPDDSVAAAQYDEWLTKRRYIDTDLYMMVVPHSVVKKQLGLKPSADMSKVREVASLNYDIGKTTFRDPEDILDLKKALDELSLDDDFDDLDAEEVDSSEVDPYTGEQTVEPSIDYEDEKSQADEFDGDDVVEVDPIDLEDFDFEDDEEEPDAEDLEDLDVDEEDDDDHSYDDEEYAIDLDDF